MKQNHMAKEQAVRAKKAAVATKKCQRITGNWKTKSMKCKIGKFSIPIEQQSNEYSEGAKIIQK